MYLNKLLLSLFVVILSSCDGAKSPLKKEIALKEGRWRMEMKLSSENILPFHFDLTKKDNFYQLVIINAKERIEVTDLSLEADSLFIQLPIFESEFLLKVKDDSTLSGLWRKYYKGDDYEIPVLAMYSKNNRFIGNLPTTSSKIASKYEVTFGPESEAPYKAIGIFEKEGNIINGTFATETGDYRHLEGNIYGDSLFLSTFNGSHAFLFKAAIKDSSLKGTFWSGNHYKENWVAVINPNASLKNPDSLTFLKEGYDKISFRFPNEKGEMISLEDDFFKEKAIIIQIMGSWCPNCLDETKYLSSLYEQHKDKGLEVIALAFERTKSKEKAFQNLRRLKEKTAANYQFLLGGATRDDKAEEALPMLNHVMSYPTAIFIDKKGAIRKIHTGFYGPSTGEYYNTFIAETDSLVQKMLN